MVTIEIAITDSMAKNAVAYFQKRYMTAESDINKLATQAFFVELKLAIKDETEEI